MKRTLIHLAAGMLIFNSTAPLGWTDEARVELPAAVDRTSWGQVLTYNLRYSGLRVL